MLTLRWYGGSQVTSWPWSSIRPDVGSSKPADHPERRRLAAAGRSEQAEELAVAHLEVDVIDGDRVAELLDHIDEPDVDLSHSRVLPRSGAQPGELGSLQGRLPRPCATSSVSPDGGPRIGVAREGCQGRELRIGNGLPAARFVALARDLARTSQQFATAGAAHCGDSGCATSRTAGRAWPPDRGRMDHIDAIAADIHRHQRTQPRMPTLTEAAILDVLRTVQEPELGRDIVTLNMVKDIAIDGQSRRDDDRADDAGLPAQGRDRGQRAGGADRRSAPASVDDHLGRDGPARGAAPGRAAPARTSRT